MSEVPNSESINSQVPASDIVEKLKAALQRDGDFPASAKLVGELRLLVADPKTNANQVTEVILREPSLGTRVLHLVNSSFYRRAKPIMTVSQAVTQIGMRPLAELCAGLVLLQKFIPAARGGGSFANCLQGTIITSLLTSSLSASTAGGSNSKADETAYLAGSFCELGTLLLAFYFPKVYENALKRSETKKQDLARSLQEITGLSPVQLSMVVIDALKLPEMYKESLAVVHDYAQGKKIDESKSTNSGAGKLAGNLFAAQKISSVLVHKGKKEDLDMAMASLGKTVSIDTNILKTVVGDLPNIFKSHCSSLDLSCPPLPDFVTSYSESSSEANSESTPKSGPEGSQFAQFVDEIREAVDSGESTASIITRVMETFAWSLGFSRVLLLLIAPGKRKLIGRMLLGSSDDFNPRSIERSIGTDAGQYAPDALAFREARAVFSGDPILNDGWPLVAVPIGFGQRCIGVIYADKLNSSQQELENWESAACTVLAEVLDRSVVMHSK